MAEEIKANQNPEPGAPAGRKVIVYSTDTCPYCRMVKDYLTQKGVAFTEINLSQNREAIKQMIDKSGQMGVPVTLIDDEVILGYNRARLEQIFTQPAA
uniref:Glutaredoxin domain-containing protein n=1 Tax=uncultured Dehalococcoidia bacterium TaxID=498747 RepID=A0A871YCB9_9CHLR|nr:hypothetical protein HULAa30F3_00020 [uncultured Dehalococcoidia bacterium]